MEPNPDPSASKGLSLPVAGHYCFPALGRWQQTDCPDDSTEGSWGAGGGGLLPDAASANLLPNSGASVALHFTF